MLVLATWTWFVALAYWVTTAEMLNSGATTSHRVRAALFLATLTSLPAWLVIAVVSVLR